MLILFFSWEGCVTIRSCSPLNWNQKLAEKVQLEFDWKSFTLKSKDAVFSFLFFLLEPWAQSDFVTL